jgi:hypothetical protein
MRQGDGLQVGLLVDLQIFLRCKNQTFTNSSALSFGSGGPISETGGHIGSKQSKRQSIFGSKI